MHPTMDLAATTSDAGDFKIWTRHHVRTKTNSASASGVDGASRATTWRCAAVGSHRNEPFTASAFSHDGSVLAVGSATGGVTLWDATEVALLATLPPALLHTSTPAGAPSPSAAVRHLLFLSRSPLLVAVFAGGVAVYNTLTLRCEWAIHLDLTAVAADPSSDHWAAVLSGTSNAQHAQQGTGAALERGVVVFKGAEEIPRAAWRARRAGPGTSVVFAPHGTPLHTAAAPVALPGCSPLFIVTSEREYSMGRGQGTTAEALGSAAAAAEGPLASRAQSFGPSAFQGLYGRSAAVEKVGDAAGVAGVADIGGRPAWAALLDAPSHALPAMGTLCPAFLELVALGEPLS